MSSASVNPSIRKPRVALGLSGGVDSAVSAALLLEQGYDVEGVFMQCWDAKADGCRSDEDRTSAARNASYLGIKFTHLDFISQYKEKVIEVFYKEYENGRTPNPDVLCNSEIKFGLFMDWALEQGYDYLATGHYARVEDGNLLAGIDPSKDQSYFLYRVSDAALAHCLFPLGSLHKSDVRKLAVSYGLPAADRPDSMGICFIGEVDMVDFLTKRFPLNEGVILNAEGERVGTHKGVVFYTIGQRHGLELTRYHSRPMYVIGKDITTNTLTIGNFEDLYLPKIEFTDIFLHKISDKYITDADTASVNFRIRHLGDLYKGDLTISPNGKSASVVYTDSDKGIFAPAAGQSVVLYKGGYVLGGGIIN